MKCKAGSEIIELIALAYRANQPVLLEGPHGVGKSQLLEEAAGHLGIEVIVRDLSLMEPPDLIGLPTQVNGRTMYAPPSFLPSKGQGILVFEELNRSERYMMSPCLQLLTARSLNDYRLPSGWLPVAAINPAGENYDTRELDPALLSRFLRIQVEADVKSWLAWASTNGVHPAVQKYVSALPSIFDSTNPRSWTYASNVLAAFTMNDKESRHTLLAALAGLVGEAHAKAFLKVYRNNEVMVSPDQVIRHYSSVRASVLSWRKDKRTDMLESIAHGVMVELQSATTCEEISSSKALSKSLREFIGDLPADIGRKVKSAAKNGGAL